MARNGWKNEKDNEKEQPKPRNFKGLPALLVHTFYFHFLAACSTQVASIVYSSLLYRYENVNEGCWQQWEKWIHVKVLGPFILKM